jgi:aspartate kinase
LLVVQKYGGTSVGNIERIKEVAKRIKRYSDDGHKVVVVVSAMSGQTDGFIDMAHEISLSPDEREMDLLMSSGERVSAALLALAITELGVSAMSFTGRQVGIVTDSAHTKARIETISATRMMEALEGGKVAVVAGFQGMTEDTGDVTTLGRGGSDLTAAAIAAAIKADVCEIYTDVDGVYTTDPNLVPEARKLEKISYEEMLELASLGAKVLHSRSVELAMNLNVPLVVRSSFNDNPGTLVAKEDEDMEKVVVSGVAYDKNQARVTIKAIPDKPGLAARIFKTVAENNINVDMIVQNVSRDGATADISCTVPKTEAKKAMEVVEALARELKAEGVSLKDDIAKVSIVGVGMKSHSGVAARMFGVLADNNINIMMISTSEIKVSCVIDAKYTELAVRVLHDDFQLAEKP